MQREIAFCLYVCVYILPPLRGACTMRYYYGFGANELLLKKNGLNWLNSLNKMQVDVWKCIPFALNKRDLCVLVYVCVWALVQANGHPNFFFHTSNIIALLFAIWIGRSKFSWRK